MNVFVTGGTGFIGRHLVRRLSAVGHRITVLTRAKGGASPFPSDVSLITGDPTQSGPWQRAVAGNDVIINLAGLSIFRRWTQEAKRIMLDGRIATTRRLVEAIAGSRANKPVLFSASAVGYYGFHGDEKLREASPPGDDFLALLARQWEEEATKAQEVASSVLLTRFGIVLGKDGGAMEKLIPLFRAFLGGPLGNGKQWMSWIHVEDLVEAFLFLMEQQGISGPVNFTAPYPVRNRDFSTALGRALCRPAIMIVPSIAIRLVMGEFGSVLLKGQRVIPGVLQDLGFRFRYPSVELAFRDVVASR